jgi:hypothetical protein
VFPEPFITKSTEQSIISIKFYKFVFSDN